MQREFNNRQNSQKRLQPFSKPVSAPVTVENKNKTEGTRINKYLADRHNISRRKADTMIDAGKILINGRRAVLGDKVKTTDKVETREKMKKDFSYYAYNKPRRLITNKQKKGEEDVTSKVNIKGVFPIGRLDKDSEGLIILSDSAKLTDKLLNPIYDHDKEYIVQTQKPIKEHQLKVMERGMNLEGGVDTKPCKAEQIDEFTFSITISEGKKHQIRRMCDAFALGVESLKRVRIMNIELGDLKPGQFRKIEGEELKTFLRSLGLS